MSKLAWFSLILVLLITFVPALTGVLIPLLVVAGGSLLAMYGFRN